jgi:hypothetical protein
MATRQVIEVPLPEGVEPTSEDLALLEGTFQAIVGLRYEGGREWEKIARRLEEDGWTVHCHLGWIAEARRGRDSEEAVGRTRAEAFAQLAELTQLDTVAGPP